MSFFNFQRDSQRKGSRDVWNAFMLEGASYDKHDIPYCPTTMTELPPRLITYEEAQKSTDYDAGVVFYKDDYKFDGLKSGIWVEPKKCVKILSKFRGGVVTPDFALNQDLPEPWKAFNVYRKQAYGFYLVKNGLKVINNVRWGSEETWDYCFRGIKKGDMVAVSTLGCIRNPDDRQRYKDGLAEMVKRIEPPIILVYGNCPRDIFEPYSNGGIDIRQYESEIQRVMREVVVNE